jgi:HEAT repeat protein
MQRPQRLAARLPGVGRIGGDRSLPVLMDAMADRDVRVRFAAQDVLY